MSCYGRNGCDDMEACGFGCVLQLDQRVLDGSVAIDTDQDGPGMVSVDGRKAVNSWLRYSPAIRRHSDDRNIVLLQGQCGKRDLPVAQIDGRGPCGHRLDQHIRRSLCAAGRAETNVYDMHILSSDRSHRSMRKKLN